VSSAAAGPEFGFAEGGQNAADRNYVMHQTVVRRVYQQIFPGPYPAAADPAAANLIRPEILEEQR